MLQKCSENILRGIKRCSEHVRKGQVCLVVLIGLIKGCPISFQPRKSASLGLLQPGTSATERPQTVVPSLSEKRFSYKKTASGRLSLLKAILLLKAIIVAMQLHNWLIGRATAGIFLRSHLANKTGFERA